VQLRTLQRCLQTQRTLLVTLHSLLDNRKVLQRVDEAFVVVQLLTDELVLREANLRLVELPLLLKNETKRVMALALKREVLGLLGE